MRKASLLFFAGILTLRCSQQNSETKKTSNTPATNVQLQDATTENKTAQNCSPKALSITGGTEFFVENDVRSDSTVLILFPRAESGKLGICTGVAVAPKLILTAAHCFFEGMTSGKSQRPEGIVYGESYTEGLSHMLKIDSFATHPDFKLETLPHDIAWIKLSENLPASLKYASLIQNSDGIKTSLKTSFVGFGPKDSMGSGNGIKRFFETNLSQLFSESAGSDSRHNLAYSDPAGGNLCPGDSGGPNFIQRDGKWILFGLTLGGVEKTGQTLCRNSTSVSTLLFPYLDWIKTSSGLQLTNTTDSVVALASGENIKSPESLCSH